MTRRLSFVFALILLMMLGLSGRALFLQILPNEKLEKRYKNQFQTAITLQPRRGLILDRKRKELASSVSAYSIFADPYMIKNPRTFARKVAKQLKIPAHKIQKKIKNKNKRFVWLKRRQVEDVKTQLEKMNLPGLGFIEESKRIYPNLHILSQTLGFVGSQGDGLEGLELKYNKDLGGEDKKIELKRDARGTPLIVNGQLITEKSDGNHLELSVDLELQYALEQELKKAMERYEAEAAMGLILKADTSEILSLATYPSFDSNRFYKAKAKHRRNRIVTDPFEPGSTMKTFAIAAALKSGKFHSKSKIFCEEGKMKVGDRWIREADQHHSFGWLKMEEVLAKSSNIGTSKIAFELGDEKIYQTLKDFGFGEKLSHLPGESKGILNPPPWRKHTLGAISFGHSVAATALQITNAYAAIANGGVLHQPQILRRILNPKGEVLEEFGPKEIRRVLTKEQAKDLKKILALAATKKGTGINAQIDGYKVAGKTGTAQKVDPQDGGYIPGKYLSSFVGFVPVKKPQYVIYISVDSPKGIYYGSEVAAPIFSRLASYAMLRSASGKNYITEEKMEKKVDQSASLWAQATAIDKIKRDMGKNRMPNVKGLSLREGLQILKEKNVKLVIRGKGKITKSLPQAGKALKEKEKVVLYLTKEI